ncbi:MAG: proton-conducting transporter membrane subunit [Bacteroidota bacterium]
MEKALQLFILIPILGFLLSLVIPKSKEKLISWLSFTTIGVHFTFFIVFLIIWLLNGFQVLNLKDFVLFKTDNYEFYIDFYFDKIVAVFVFVGCLLTFLVTVYSRYYLHRENGYKRFFNTILFFYLGFTIIIFSGNLETLFVGWEILGISSFLLIAFYRDRYLPVRNAVKVFSIYRIGDVGLILAMWLSHHLFHSNITFLQLSNYNLVSEHLQNHSLIGITISIMILLSATAKSAQFPFSYWLPRAMEGPTPSSAIFYGSLSVHIGAFVLLRTFPFWEHQFSVRVLIIVLGIVSSIIATFTARVQSTVKSQIAYSSIAQIGLIFIEIALGFENVALLHFAGNAFLRTYQLLVSPSVVSYLIREQFYNFVPRKQTIEDSFPKKVEYTIYLLSLKEWNLDYIMSWFIWKPIKKLGEKLKFLTLKRVLLFFIPFFVLGTILLFNQKYFPVSLIKMLPILFALIGLVFVLKSFSERKSAFKSWILIIMNHFWIALAVSFNENYKLDHIALYLSGVVLAGIFGYFILRKLKKLENHIHLDDFQGHSYEHPRLAFLFLLTALGLSGFPVTPTFIGEDLIFSHIHENQILLAFLVSFSFIIDGIALIRMYARIFLGPHVKTYHESAYKSS